MDSKNPYLGEKKTAMGSLAEMSTDQDWIGLDQD